MAAKDHLDGEKLIEAARAAAGLDDFGGDSHREGLAVLVESLCSEARLNEVGELAFQSQIEALLVNRLRVEDWTRTHAEIARAPVARPLFILGLPRTGTTLLSQILACDRGNRSLMRWEVLRCCPPPEGRSMTTDPRIAEEAAAQEMLDALNPGFRAIHYEPPDGPTECVTVLGQDLRSLHFETLAMIPSYGAWHERCDMRPAYAYHRKVLALLQSRAPGRWVLKTPAHCLALDALVETYPDARFVMTHRDPERVAASVCSLVRSLAGTFSDHVDPEAVARRWTGVLALCLERAMDFRARRGSSAFVDVAYEDLVRDPLGSVRAIYADLSWELSGEAEARMRRYAQENPQGRHGAHRYAPVQAALAGDAVLPTFRSYRERFAVPPEH